MGYSSFNEKLKKAPDSESKVKVSAEGLSNNVFFRNVWTIHESNLPTLKIKEPGVYETVTSREVREALVLTGLFQVSRSKSPKEEDLEIEMPNTEWRYYFNRFYMRVMEKQYWRFEPLGLEEYRGRNAVMVAVKAISTLFANLVTPESPWPDTQAERFFKMTTGPYGKDQKGFKYTFEVVKNNLWKHKKRVSQLLGIILDEQ